MSRKHYHQFVAIFADTLRKADDAQTAIIVDVMLPKFITACKADNPKFDETKFINALDEALA